MLLRSPDGETFDVQDSLGILIVGGFPRTEVVSMLQDLYCADPGLFEEAGIGTGGPRRILGGKVDAGGVVLEEECRVCDRFGTVPDSSSTSGRTPCPVCNGTRVKPRQEK